MSKRSAPAAHLDFDQTSEGAGLAREEAEQHSGQRSTISSSSASATSSRVVPSWPGCPPCLRVLGRLGGGLLLGGSAEGGRNEFLKFSQLLLEPLDPRLQAGDLALVACRQLDQELDAGIPAGVTRNYRFAGTSMRVDDRIRTGDRLDHN